MNKGLQPLVPIKIWVCYFLKDTKQISYTELSYKQIQKDLGYDRKKTAKALDQLKTMGYIAEEVIPYRGFPRKRYYILRHNFMRDNNSSKFDINNSSKNGTINSSKFDTNNSSKNGTNQHPFTPEQPIDSDVGNNIKTIYKQQTNKQEKNGIANSTVRNPDCSFVRSLDMHSEKEENRSEFQVKRTESKVEGSVKISSKESLYNTVIDIQSIKIDLLDYIKWNNAHNRNKIENPKGFIIAYNKDPTKFDLETYINFVKERQRKKELKRKKEEQEKMEELKRQSQEQKRKNELNKKIKAVLKDKPNATMLFNSFVAEAKRIGMEMYLGSLELIDAEPDKLKFKASNDFVKEKVNTKFLKTINNKLDGVIQVV